MYKYRNTKTNELVMGAKSRKKINYDKWLPPSP